ncbi:MAG TPA: hypothetical protein VFL97_08020 [Nitrococcus sp.]|nr:hypothetical protein [Nitrococcus sp.]
MPNFDGGHYFLTVLAPISDRILKEGDCPSRACVQILRETLACLPTARQSPSSEAGDLNSPFARNRRTHFARFAVLEDVVYNGRDQTDALKTALTDANLSIPQPVDHLNTPYLLFAADFDAASGDQAELRGYLTELWTDMEQELRAVFRHCIGFETVDDAGAFADYIQRCQVETTMPFNDYWAGIPPLQDLNQVALLAPIALPAAVALLCGAFWLLDNLGLPLGDRLVAGFGADGGWPWGWLAVAAGAVTGLIGYGLYRFILHRGSQPLPSAPHSDLPSVLKALYLQQQLTRFAIEQQGADAAALQRAFGEFLARHRPDDLEHATQAPGVIRS